MEKRLRRFHTLLNNTSEELQAYRASLLADLRWIASLTHLNEEEA